MLSRVMNDKLKEIYYVTGKHEGWDRCVKERPYRLFLASRLKVTHLFELEPHNGKCAIVGSAPSIGKHLDRIKEIKNETYGCVMPINGAHGWLVANGVIPTVQVFFEIDEDDPVTICQGPLHRQVYYYPCSHCSRRLFNRLKGYHRVLWHAFDDDPEYQAIITKLFPGEFMVGGGFSTIFRLTTIARIMGYRHFEYFGCDCSFTDDNTHYDGYNKGNSESTMIVKAGTRDNCKEFKTTPFLSFLAHDFMSFCDVMDAQKQNLFIKVHGDGMLRFLHQMKYPEMYS